ncbi:hypothetical protein FGRMN_2861 [Fusarium graminum]|nr:hypothetical protein FGRMN_2861 [Fusarium graminum]
MCVRGRVVFSCAHERWGFCVKQCETARDFCEEKETYDCRYKTPHVPTSRKLETKCNACIAMEQKLDNVKKGIEDLRLMLKMIENNIMHGKESDKMEVEGQERSMDFVTELKVICEDHVETRESEDDGTE